MIEALEQDISSLTAVKASKSTSYRLQLCIRDVLDDGREVVHAEILIARQAGNKRPQIATNNRVGEKLTGDLEVVLDDFVPYGLVL